MDTTHTPTPKEALRPGEAYKLPEAQRQAILQGSDFARTRALIHAQREKFLARNKSGLVAEIESYGFDIDDVQAAMNLAAEKNNGISWDLIPPSLPV